MPKSKQRVDKKQDKRIAKLFRRVGEAELKMYASEDSGTLAVGNMLQVVIGYPTIDATATANSRVGNKITIHEMQIRLAFNATAEMAEAVMGTNCRAILYSQRNNVGTNATDEELLFDAADRDYLAAPNINPGLVGRYLGRRYNSNPVTVWRDSGPFLLSNLPGVPAAVADTYSVSSIGSANPVKYFVWKLRFKTPLTVRFDGAASAITDITHNPLIIGLMGNSTVGYNWKAVVYYYDE